ncbi:hypothetical protein K435DRAFT_757155 [Dendrothele bispora CBS 962.96]|uniref:FHA domain-containing protein n=1 Tax=Dendrothele bispora (strain CBS 962.96) TaxID=1314807 RepID=A0A4V4HF69_DENBC|nr:hypothetical protein K435DRAFT_757155 [Dendrothele bispora CBS 962.96]
MSIPTPPMINLKATADSFNFPEKFIFLQGAEYPPTILGLQSHPTHGQLASRRALPTNGYFGQTVSSLRSTVSPIALGANHAQVWTASDQIFIEDTDSSFGTFINDERLDSRTPRALKTGDILRLGIQLTRSSDTPENVTDEQLRPIIAKVILTGIPGAYV